jgi:hypothetical protein
MIHHWDIGQALSFSLVDVLVVLVMNTITMMLKTEIHDDLNIALM